MEYKWEQGWADGNVILLIDDHHYVSYNESSRLCHEGPETALVVRDGGEPRFLILLGDWRQQYEEAARKDGLGACLALFKANRDKEGRWSDGLPSDDMED